MRRVAASLATLCLLAACGGSEQPATPTSQTTEPNTVSTAVNCIRGATYGKTETVSFKTRDGTRIQGVSILPGATFAVVFANQPESDVCSWMPYAYRFTGQGGPQLFLFNFPETSALADYVDAAADQAREQGAESIVLVGASNGAAASLVTAARRTDVVAVASLSAPQRFEDLDALAAVERLEVPLFFAAARRDGRFAADAKALHGNASADQKSLLLVDGFQHGTELLQDEKVVLRLGRFVFLATQG